ncbi:hypothetical protein pipiens_005438 [Culex pipiens pipiens]|uniref:Tudor domain-containing protein n=1 Tax=Culex pipiens pipiens TaxID=38569 RepID=A0ABD1DWS5_CULPP
MTPRGHLDLTKVYFARVDILIRKWIKVHHLHRNRKQNPANDDTDKKEEVVETLSVLAVQPGNGGGFASSCTVGPGDEVKRLRKKLPVLLQKVYAAKLSKKHLNFSVSTAKRSRAEPTTDEHTPIDRWLPAKPIEKTITVGKSSYVDNNGLIYLEQKPVSNALRKVINAKFADSSATDKFYSDNEPCMAKFHQDNKFVYIAIGCRRYKVQFIDYGNIEEVDIADLPKNVNCGRVPIQMNRYRLMNVAPKKATPGRRKSSTRCTH